MTRSIVAGAMVGVAAGVLVLLAADRLLPPPPPVATIAVAREAERGAPAPAAAVPRRTWAAEVIRPELEAGPSPGPHAQGVAPGRDGDRMMRAVLDAHQAGVADLLQPALQKALFTRASDACGIDFARREQRPWFLNGMLAVDLQITADQAVVGDVFFPPEHQASIGDDAFRACFHGAVVGARVACRGCKPGSLTVPYPVNLRLYRPGHGADAGRP